MCHSDSDVEAIGLYVEEGGGECVEDTVKFLQK